jgi:hypothetical protein
MANIVIEDLAESLELDRKAMMKIVGGKTSTPVRGGLRSHLLWSSVTESGLKNTLGVWSGIQPIKTGSTL